MHSFWSHMLGLPPKADPETKILEQVILFGKQPQEVLEGEWGSEGKKAGTERINKQGTAAGSGQGSAMPGPLEIAWNALTPCPSWGARMLQSLSFKSYVSLAEGCCWRRKLLCRSRALVRGRLKPLSTSPWSKSCNGSSVLRSSGQGRAALLQPACSPRVQVDQSWLPFMREKHVIIK